MFKRLSTTVTDTVVEHAGSWPFNDNGETKLEDVVDNEELSAFEPTEDTESTVYIRKVAQWIHSGSFVLPDLVAEEEKKQLEEDWDLDSPFGDFAAKIVAWQRFKKIYLAGKLRLERMHNQADHTRTILFSRPVCTVTMDGAVVESYHSFIDVQKPSPPPVSTFHIFYCQL